MPIINLGNKDGYESLHAFGMVQGAYVTGQFMRNWIFHVPGSTSQSPANVKALTTFQQWFKDGYFGSDYNAVGENDAAAAFAKGKGVFYLGGNWQAAVIQSRPQGQRRVHEHAPGPERQGRRDRLDEPAVAHLLQDEVRRRRRRPHQLAHRGAGLGAADVRPEPDPGRRHALRPPRATPYLTSVANGWQALVKSDGLTLFPDWASTNMLTVMGTEFQKMIAGRAVAGGHRQDDPGRVDDVRQDAQVSEASPRLGRARGHDDRRARPGTPRARGGRQRRTTGRAPGEPRNIAYLYILPGLAAYLLFTFFPLLQTVRLSFYDWDGLTPKKWIGLGNYRELWHTPEIRDGLPAFVRADPLLRGLLDRASGCS